MLHSISRTGMFAVPFIVCSLAFAQDAPPAPQQAPPAQQETPQQPAPSQEPQPAPAPKPIPRTPVDPENIESMASIALYYWRPNGQPGFRAGEGVPNPDSRYFNMSGDATGFGGLLTFPTGGFNRMEIAFTRTRASGASRPGKPLQLFGANIRANDLVASDYQIDVLSARWNYLTFPVPPLDARLRIKTFWEVQYTKIKPTLSFPEIVNEEGNQTVPPLMPDQSIFWPGAGIGFEYVPTRAFRIEGGASGMTWPGRSRYFNADAQAVVRVGRLELFGGYKMYYFRTSPQQEVYITGTLLGPVGGVRWVFD